MRTLLRLVRCAILAAPCVPAIAQQPGPEAAPLMPAQRWALVVGASDYEYLGRLRYATRDAHAFADALVADLGFAPDTVRVLTDDADDPKLTPTAGHLIGELEALLADPRRNQSDLFVFYFCGHGVGLDDGDYLLPTDARRETRARVGLPIREVVDRLATAGMRNVLVLADACRLGTENSFGRELYDRADAARLSVVLGCEPGKQSYEEAQFGHGVFTHFLLEALRDPSLRDSATGALWASRVLRRAADAVHERTSRQQPVQSPVVWSDPTRDVLLSATLPTAISTATLDGFVQDAGRLAPDAQRAAMARFAFDLFEAGRFDDAIAVLKTAEQLGPLPPEMAQVLGASFLFTGRSVEAARAFRALRESAPDSIPALAATVTDTSGAVPAADRAHAAAELWDRGVAVPFGLLVRMVVAQLAGGSANVAHAMATTAAAQAPAGSRDREFLTAILAILERRPDDALASLARAEAAPGEFPPDEHLAFERMSILESTRGTAAAVAFVDACIARWPESGAWYARRAWLRRRGATSRAEFDTIRDDVRAAVTRPLEPDALLLAVRAAGSYAIELPEAIAARAADHPLAWEAQIASVFARQPANMREAVAAVARLAARPAVAYATMARLTLDSAMDRYARFELELAPDAPERNTLRDECNVLTRTLYERIAPMASDLGGDTDGWKLLAELSERLVTHEVFFRLFDREFGAAIDAARLPEDLVVTAALACVNTGRIARLRDVARSMRSDRPDRDTLRWLEIAALACRGDDDEARRLDAASDVATFGAAASFAPLVHALVLARAGEPDAARAALVGTNDDTPLNQCLHGLVLRALGDDAGATRLLDQVRAGTPRNAFFAFEALWASEPAVDPRDLAQTAATYQPGNPLVRRRSFAANPGLAAFTGLYEFKISDASGPIAAVDAALTLTVSQQGKVRGTLELPDGDALVVRGTLDEYGNLEGELVRSDHPLTLLAKLAPRDTYADYGFLRSTGQHVLVLGTDGVPYGWICRPAW